jgi:transposase-like protein
MKKDDNEFKQQAVKKILDGQSVTSVSRECRCRRRRFTRLVNVV